MDTLVTILGLATACLLYAFIWALSEKNSVWKEYSNYRKNVDEFVKEELGFFEEKQTFRDVGAYKEHMAFGDGKIYCIDDSILRKKSNKKNNK